MHPIRTGLAIDCRQRAKRLVPPAPPAAAAVSASKLKHEFKLFASTFAAGFLFVSIFFA